MGQLSWLLLLVLEDGQGDMENYNAGQHLSTYQHLLESLAFTPFHFARMHCHLFQTLLSATTVALSHLQNLLKRR